MVPRPASWRALHPNGETKGYRFDDNGRLTDAIAEDGTAREFEQCSTVPYGDERRVVFGVAE